MSKPDFVGIDVSAKELVVARLGEPKPKIFANDRRGHKALIKNLNKSNASVQVCLEATGIYSLDVAMALSRARGIEVMVANPRAVKDFAGAMMSRSKTDALDAVVLAEYAARMPFVPYVPCSAAALKLRGISRRIAALGKLMTAEKNRLHADEATQLGEAAGDIKVHIRFLKKRIEVLRERAVKLIHEDVDLSQKYDFLVSVTGIARISAVQILGELAMLPDDMNKRQWTAHAGLDPRHFDSGTSIHKRARISKAGNGHLRKALYMPALVAIRRESHVGAYYDHLIEADKKPLQAIVAVMRKLLCAIWGMFSSQQTFDGSRFFAREVVSA